MELDILKNELSLKAFNVLLQDFNYKISNVKAKQAIITFKITDIIKNKIETNNITIKQGGLDIYDFKEFVQINPLNNAKKRYAFNNVVFKEINIPNDFIDNINQMISLIENNKENQALEIFNNLYKEITKN